MATGSKQRNDGHHFRPWTGALFFLLGTLGSANAGEPGAPHAGHAQPFRRFAPVGGWHPDDGGLLHWWNPHCFPRCGSPDDYCRKPPPRVCWPPYSPSYVYTPSRLGNFQPVSPGNPR